MDENIELKDNGTPWDIEEPTDECFLFRQVHHSQRQGGKKRRYPNEAHFELREGEKGLSFNWNRYVDDERSYTLIGLTHGRDGGYLNPINYILFKYPLRFLKAIDKVQKIEHTPVFHPKQYPSPVGVPNNRSHVEVEYDPEDLGVRVILAEYCNDNFEVAKSDFDRTALFEDLEELRARANNTPFHKDWCFDNSTK